MKTEKQSPGCKRYVSVRRVEDNVGFWAFFTWVDGNNNHSLVVENRQKQETSYGYDATNLTFCKLNKTFYCQVTNKFML